jgi:trypsin
MIHFEGGSVSQKLLKANVTIQDNSVCTSQYGSGFNGKAMLCASAPGKGPCRVRFSNGIVYSVK